MFLVSGVDLVVAACRNGVIGAFPTVNCRSPGTTRRLARRTSKTRLRRHSDASGKPAAPICPNLIVHRSKRAAAKGSAGAAADRPEIVITSVGSPAPCSRPA